MNMVVDIPIGEIEAPDWNPNEMDEDMRQHLRRSIQRFGNLVPLVVRMIDPDSQLTGVHTMARTRTILRDQHCCFIPHLPYISTSNKTQKPFRTHNPKGLSVIDYILRPNTATPSTGLRSCES